jgi:hypothetical protein
MINAYPNPFNPAAAIRFTLREASYVELTVFDLQGRGVVDLVDGWRAAGVHEVTFNGSNLASGVYVYRLRAGEFQASAKVVLMK